MEVETSRLTYLLPPAPTILISTIDRNGRKNLAAYDSNMPCSKKPPMVAVAIRDFQHTYRNIMDVGEFVIGVPSSSMIYEVWKCGNKDEKCEDEFKEVGLTPVPSEKVKPFRIKECQVNLECIRKNEIKLGTHNIVFGEVIKAYVDNDLFSENDIELRKNLDSIHHISKTYFIRKGKEVNLKTKFQ